MRTVSFILDGRQTSIQYTHGIIDGRVCLVLMQPPVHPYALAVVRERFVAWLLNNELADVEPSKLRVFSYYPPSTGPAFKWSEERFEGIQRREVDRGTLQQMIDRFLGVKQELQPYVVWNPHSHEVSPSLIAQLQQLDQALR